MYKCETANTLTCYYYVLLLLLLLLPLLAYSYSIPRHSFICSFARLIEERMKRKEIVTRCKVEEEENEMKWKKKHISNRP